MTSGRIADATSETPYLVSRRLRRLGGPELGRRDSHALAWIGQAADLIDAMATERRRLVLALNNYSRPKCRVVRIERDGVKSGAKVKAEPRVGRLVRNGPKQAETVAELIVGTVDLYRVANGIRVAKAGAKVKDGEFLGRFDEGADFKDIQDAIA